jgi:Fe2+ transport system protein B
MIIVSVLTYRLHRKKKLITFDVQQGIKCYSCKQDIVPDIEQNQLDKFNQLSNIYTRISQDEKSQDFKMCMSCSRDEKLQDLTSKFFIKKQNINNIKRSLYSKKLDKMFILFLFIMIFGHVIDFTIRYYSDLKTPFGSLFTILYWLLWYKKSTLSYGENKKPSN